MQHLKVVTLVAFFALAAAGCSSGGSSNSNTTNTAASPTPTSVIHAEQNALPLAVAAKIPSGLKCSSQDIVWVNMHTKAFHDPGDPYYGKTKNGMYMCRADAVAQGDHPAGARHSHMNSSNSTEASAAPEATATPRHRRHHSGD